MMCLFIRDVVCHLCSSIDIPYMFSYRDNIEPDNSKNLGTNLTEAHRVIETLQSTNWLNKREGSAMIEVMGYTANVDLFHLIVVIIELPRVGAAFVTGVVQSLHFHGYSRNPPWLSLAIVLLFASVIVIYSFYVVRKMWKLGVLLFIHDFWNLLDFLIILLAWCMVVIDRSYDTVLEHTVQTYHASRDVQFQYIVSMYLWRSFFFGLTTFVIILRCFQFLEMLSLFNRFLIVLEHISRFIISVIILVVLQFFAIATFIYLMAGDHHSEFNTIGTSMMNVLLGVHFVVSKVFDDVNYRPYTQFDVTLFFFVLFLVIVNFITLSFTFAIVYSTFVEFFVKHPEIDRMQLLVKEYFAKQWKIGEKGKNDKQPGRRN